MTGNIFLYSAVSFVRSYIKIREDVSLKIKKILILVSFTIFMSFTTGCSTKSWYEGAQISAKQNCNNAPSSEREQCLKNINQKTYKEYQQEH